MKQAEEIRKRYARRINQAEETLRRLLLGRWEAELRRKLKKWDTKPENRWRENMREGEWGRVIAAREEYAAKLRAEKREKLESFEDQVKDTVGKERQRLRKEMQARIKELSE